MSSARILWSRVYWSNLKYWSSMTSTRKLQWPLLANDLPHETTDTNVVKARVNDPQVTINGLYTPSKYGWFIIALLCQSNYEGYIRTILASPSPGQHEHQSRLRQWRRVLLAKLPGAGWKLSKLRLWCDIVIHMFWREMWMSTRLIEFMVINSYTYCLRYLLWMIGI